ncbi:MAG: polysaccharide deacetylase family protein [Patescibacteria group bacterium]
MKSSTLKISTLFLALSLAVLALFVLARSEIAASSRFIGSKSYTFQYVQPSTPLASLETGNKEGAPQTKNDPAVPILMYHHIRNYNNPSDQAGQILSVSPQRFSEQLDLLIKMGYTTVTFADIKENRLPAKPIILTFDDGYANFYKHAYPELQKRQMKAVVYVIINFVGKDGYLNWNEIAEIARNQIEVGSHTLTHLNLAAASRNRTVQELTESKKIIENKTGREVLSLCYPSGKYSDEVISVAAESEYAYAVTTRRGSADFSSPLELKRYRINSDTSILPLLEK